MSERERERERERELLLVCVCVSFLWRRSHILGVLSWYQSLVVSEEAKQSAQSSTRARTSTSPSLCASLVSPQVKKATHLQQQFDKCYPRVGAVPCAISVLCIEIETSIFVVRFLIWGCFDLRLGQLRLSQVIFAGTGGRPELTRFAGFCRFVQKVHISGYKRVTYIVWKLYVCTLRNTYRNCGCKPTMIWLHCVLWLFRLFA